MIVGRTYKTGVALSGEVVSSSRFIADNHDEALPQERVAAALKTTP